MNNNKADHTRQFSSRCDSRDCKYPIQNRQIFNTKMCKYPIHECENIQYKSVQISKRLSKDISNAQIGPNWTDIIFIPGLQFTDCKVQHKCVEWMAIFSKIDCSLVPRFIFDPA